MSTKVSQANNAVPSSFREDLEACVPALQIRALKLCLNSSEAQDLVQDTVERALRFQDTFRPGTNLRAWAQQVLFSVFVTRCRKLRRERRALDAFRVDPNAWTPSSTRLVVRELTPSMSQALDGLPDKFKSVLELIDLHDHSYKEAAVALDVPVGTVMSRLFRGRRQLALRLGEMSVETRQAEAA